jgi:hypothetical protein
MAIDYKALLDNPNVRLALGRRRFAKAAENNDYLLDIISEEGRTLLTFSNEEGGNFLSEWCGFYFVTSTEYEPNGPFESLDGALTEERFWLQIREPEIRSEIVPLPKLKAIGNAVASEGEAVFINGTRYVLSGGKLVEEEED